MICHAYCLMGRSYQLNKYNCRLRLAPAKNYGKKSSKMVPWMMRKKPSKIWENLLHKNGMLWYEKQCGFN